MKATFKQTSFFFLNQIKSVRLLLYMYKTDYFQLNRFDKIKFIQLNGASLICFNSALQVGVYWENTVECKYIHCFITILMPLLSTDQYKENSLIKKEGSGHHTLGRDRECSEMEGPYKIQTRYAYKEWMCHRKQQRTTNKLKTMFDAIIISLNKSKLTSRPYSHQLTMVVYN